MLKHLPVTGKQLQITPDDIDASKHLWNAFDHSETEISAGWIIRFLQKRGKGWEPFSLLDLKKFYAEKYSDGFRFNKLIDHGWIEWVDLKADIACVTADFICRCYESSPRLREYSHE